MRWIRLRRECWEWVKGGAWLLERKGVGTQSSCPRLAQVTSKIELNKGEGRIG